MILYQKRNLINGYDVGEPGNLPDDLIGLADESLSDLAWTSEPLGYQHFGFFPVTVEEPPEVPQVISAMQARLALLAVGKLDEVEGYIAQAETPRDQKIYWEYVSELNRDHSLVTAIGGLLGFSNEELDNLFIAAKQIV